MNILDEIIAYKKLEVAKRKGIHSVKQLESSPAYMEKIFSLKQFLLNDEKTGIIAEFKRRSPSKGIINANADVTAVTKCYTDNGAAGLSVLTDEHFFGGSTTDLENARVNNVPILRKDFIIDEYQVVEARAMGADVILLIAACLSPKRVNELAQFAKSLGLEVLLELHNENELEHICAATEIIGINNRDLKTFTVDIDRSLAMAAQIPAGKIKVAESGISAVENIILFKQNGFRGFLIGEHFMKEPDPTIAFVKFIKHLKQKQNAN